MYHDADHLRTVAEILAEHAGHPLADLRRAILLTEAEELVTRQVERNVFLGSEP